MNRRRRRDQRRPGIRVVVGPRDDALLRGLRRFRAATTTQLVRIFFRGIRRDTACVRLRRLFDGGLLAVIRAGPALENVYALGPVGRGYLLDRGLSVANAPSGRLDHHLGLIEVWTLLAEALHGSRSVRLARVVPDWEARREGAGTGLRVIPDAEVILSTQADSAQGSRVRLFVEVDRGTERHSALTRKLSAYAAERFETGAGLVAILENAGEGRLESVRRLLADHWPSWSLVCPMSRWPDDLLGCLGLANVPPLDPSPRGKGSLAPASSSTAVECLDQGDGPSRLSASSDSTSSEVGLELPTLDPDA